MNKEEFIDLVLRELNPQTSVPEKETVSIGGVDLGFTRKSRSQNVGTQESLLRSLVRHSGFSNQKKQEKNSLYQLQKSPINKQLLELFPDTVQLWADADTGFPYTLIMIEFEKTAKALLNLNIFNNKIQLLDALQRVSKDVIENWWNGSKNKKEKMKRTLVTLSVKDDVNESHNIPHLLYFSHYTDPDFEYFYLTNEVKQWSIGKPQRAKTFIGSIYERHFVFLSTILWKKAFVTEQEKQHVQNLYQVCFVEPPKKGTKKEREEAKEALNQVIYKAAESLIHEVGKDFLSTDFKAIPLDNGHFIGANAKERGKKNFTNSLQGFGVELGELVLGYCVVQRKDKGALAILETKMSMSNHLSNVLIIFIDKEEMVIQLWKGKQKLESKLGKNAQTQESEVNRVVTTIRRFFQVSRNIECSPQQLAEEKNENLRSRSQE